LVLIYRGGLEAPSWLASDGALRLLTLTLPAYLPECRGVYLIEEPENGIHPRAVETMFQSLSSVYDAQILLATHSPILLSIVKPEQVLCFAKSSEGATDIVQGSDHPALKNWRRETSLGVRVENRQSSPTDGRGVQEDFRDGWEISMGVIEILV
jgi:predicted ATP-dependent endonuclease of OLD family